MKFYRTRQLTEAIDFYSIFFYTIENTGQLVTNILQNISFFLVS